MIDILPSLEEHMTTYWLPEGLNNYMNSNPKVILKYKGKDNF